MAVPPSKPGNPAITPGDKLLSFTFAPSDSGDVPISYTASIVKAGTTLKTKEVFPSIANEFADLENGQVYTIKVYATNAGGDSNTAEANQKPNGPAISAIITSIDNTKDNELTVNFTPSTSPLSYISNYIVSLAATGRNVPQQIVTSSASSATFTGLVSGIEYTATVTTTYIGGSIPSVTSSKFALGNALPVTITDALVNKDVITVYFTRSATPSEYLDAYIVTLTPTTGESKTSSVDITDSTSFNTPFTGLQQFMEYTVKVETQGIEGSPVNRTLVSSNTLTKTTGGDLLEPSSITVDASVKDQVTISGGVVVGATTYKVQAFTAVFGDLSIDKIGSLPIILTTADGLLPGTKYHFSIKGVRGDIIGPGVFSDPIQAPGTPYIPPSTAISSIEKTTNSAVVNINITNVPIGLTYYCSATSATETKLSNEVSSRRVIPPFKFLFNNLTLGTTYTLAVHSKGDEVNDTNYPIGKSNYIPPITFETLNVLPPTIDPLTVADGTLEVNFTPATQDSSITATGYTVSLSPGNAASPAIGIDGPYSAEFTGLTNGVTYTATVTANSSSGNASATATGTPNGPLPAPTGIFVTPAEGRLSVSYNTLPGAVSYSAQAYLNDVAVGTAVTGTTPSLLIPNLVNGALYTIKVKAKDAADVFGIEATSLANVVSGIPAVPTAAVPSATIGATTANVVINSTPTLRYSVTIQKLDNSVAFTSLAPDTATSSSLILPVKDLDLNTEYNVFVTVYPNISVTGVTATEASANFTTLNVLPPTNIAVVPAPNKLTVNFTPATQDSSIIATGYTVSLSPGNVPAQSILLNGPYSAEFTGLTNGVTYTATVTVNTESSGSSSATATGMPNGPPAAPSFTVYIPSDVVTAEQKSNELQIDYSSASGDYVTSYDIILTPAGGIALNPINVTDQQSVTINPTNYPSIKLIAGKTYSIVVRANSANGSTSSLPKMATPVGSAEPVTIMSIDADNKKITVNFSASATPSVHLDSYIVVLTPLGGSNLTSLPIPVTEDTSYSYTFEGLENYKEHSAKVIAKGNGELLNTTAINSINTLKASPTGPDAPTNIRAQASSGPNTVFASGNAVVYFNPSVVPSGGSLIKEYTVTSSPGGLFGSGSASPITVSGLTNGTAYTFTVTAKNELDKVSLPSNATSPGVTPTSVPDAPTLVSAVAGDGKVTLTFTTPSDGGADIEDYSVFCIDGTGERSKVASSSPFDYTDLENGKEYEFSVCATNSNGSSLLSNAIKATPATLEILEMLKLNANVIPNVKIFMNSVDALNIEDGDLLKFADLGVSLSVLTNNDHKKKITKKIVNLVFGAKEGLNHFMVEKSAFPIVSKNAKDKILVVRANSEEVFEMPKLDSSTSIYVALENEYDLSAFKIGEDEFTIEKTEGGYDFTYNETTTSHVDGGEIRVNDLLIVFGGGSISFDPFNQAPYPCYARGTLIGTSRGMIPIEQINLSDKLRTYDCIKEKVFKPVGGIPFKTLSRVLDKRFKNRFAGIKYIGNFTVNRMNEHTAPIHITAGALGYSKPERDLLVSPNHSMLIGDRLILAKNLVNGSTIYQDMSFNKIEYFHVLSDDHYLINANGALSETLGSEEMSIFEALHSFPVQNETAKKEDVDMMLFTEMAF